MTICDIFTLNNTFETFGFNTIINHNYDKKNNQLKIILQLEKKDYLTEKEAEKIFKNIITAFKINTRKTWKQNRLKYIFNKNTLTIIECKINYN
jgi:hypothetical protein